MATAERATSNPPKRKSAKRAKKPAVKSSKTPSGTVPTADKTPLEVAGSAIYLRVPHKERMRLDRAILLPAESGQSLEEVARELRLNERFGITSATLNKYASKLKEVARPLVTSQVMAALIECLPPAQRRSVFQGSQVLLLSKVLESLNSTGSELSVPDLAKVATVLTSVAKSRGSSKKSAAGNSSRGESAPASHQAPFSADKLAESVRMVYGISG